MARGRRSNVVKLAAAPEPEAPDEGLPSRPTVGEAGISGTTNWSGDIFDEENSRLFPQLAYGLPGTRTWGEYQRAIRTDSAVAAALEFVASMIRDALVTVEAAKEDDADEPTPEAQAQADFVRWNLLEHMSPGWAEVIQRIVKGALGYGFEIEEIVADSCENDLLPGGVGFAVKKLADRLPVSVHVNGWIEKNGELEAIRQWGQGRDQNWVEVLLPASKVLLFSWNRSGNNYRGVSHMRPVYYPIRVRQQLVRLIGVQLVREGAGIPTAYAEDKDAPLTKKQREKLQQLLANLVFHENASVVMPPGWKLEWVFSGSANKGHVVDAWNQLGLVILQQCQAQHLYLGTQNTGSRSVGEVHTAQARNFAQGVIAFVEGVFNGVGDRPYTGLVKKIVDWNWGPQKAYPKLKLTLKRADLGPAERMQAIKTAKDAGALTITTKDENIVREELSLEPITEEEREANKPPPPSLFGLPGGPGEEDEEEDGDEGEEKTLPFPPKKKASAGMGDPPPFTPRRALRPSEERLDLAAIDTTLRNARKDFVEGIRPIVVEALVKLAPEIRDAMADGDPSEVAALKLPTDKIGDFVARFITDVRTAGTKEAAKEKAKGPGILRDRWVDPQPPATAASKDEDKTARAMRKQVVRRLEQKILGDLENEALEAIRHGKDVDETIKNTVKNQIDGGGFSTDAGLLVTRSFNMGREDFAAAQGDKIESVELSAVLDGAQCVPCDNLDGDEFEPFSEEHIAHVPPLVSICDGGGNCRCILIYNYKDDAE